MNSTDIHAERASSTDTQEKAQIGVRVPAELALQIERIAYQETEPGGQTVTQSEVTRAALRHYVKDYENGDAPTAHESGAADAADTIYGEEPAVGD